MWLLWWILFGLIGGAVAVNKGRSGCLWSALGFLFGPFALVFAFLMPSTDAEDKERALAGEDASTYRKCPYCAEAIRREAIKCRYCQSDVEPVA